MQKKTSFNKSIVPHNEFLRDFPDINNEIYNSLTNYLATENLTKIAQPNLIIGEDGSGKTFLLHKIIRHINKNFSNKFIPIIIEGKSLYSTKNIWNKCALHLNISGKNNTFDEIINWQKENSKRIILLIDNIQYYFERTNNVEHYDFRGKIYKAGAPIIVATSNNVLPAFTEYNAAFFDGFKISYLKPLNSETIKNIVGNKYDISRIEKLMFYLPKTIKSLIITLEIISRNQDSANDIQILLDLYNLYFQSKYDSLSTPTQKILTSISHSDNNIILSEIREKTGLENGKISPYLKLMINQKVLGKETKTERGGAYYITDPLFKLWLKQNC